MKRFLILLVLTSPLFCSEPTRWQKTKDFVTCRPMMVVYGALLGGKVVHAYFCSEMGRLSENVINKINEIVKALKDPVNLSSDDLKSIRTQVHEDITQEINLSRTQIENTILVLNKNIMKQLQELKTDQTKQEQENKPLNYPIPDYEQYQQKPYPQKLFGEIISDVMSMYKENNVIRYIENITNHPCIIKPNLNLCYLDNTYSFRIYETANPTQIKQAAHQLSIAKQHLEFFNEYQKSKNLPEVKFTCTGAGFKNEFHDDAPSITLSKTFIAALEIVLPKQEDRE